MNAPQGFSDMINPRVVPPEMVVSQFGMSAPPATRAVDTLEDLVSVKLTDMFPDIDPAMIGPEDDIPATQAAVRMATVAALEAVDFSMIQARDSVHILCSDHGFIVLGGWAYAEMIKTVKDVLVERTGNMRVKLVYACSFVAWEGMDILPRFGLVEYFENRTVTAGPADRGVAIETELGTLYGVKKAFNAKWLIHCHYDCPREIHYHRFNGRSLKAFGMSYARMETRSVFHNNFGPRNANIVTRAIYESDYVQSRFAAGLMLTTSPNGVCKVMADRDLIAMDKRMTADSLRNYGKLYTLFNRIDCCVPICDGYRWGLYHMAGGISVCGMFEGTNDHLDMESTFIAKNNPAVKGFVINNTWVGAENMMEDVPMILSSQAVKDSFIPNMHDPENMHVADGLPAAVALAKEMCGTDQFLVFDGSYESINVSRSLAEHLLELAPEVAKDVDEVRMPKWYKQRGIAHSV